MVKTIRKIERHTVLYIDEYQVDDADIKAYGSLEKLLDDEEELSRYHVDQIVDDISNKNGDYEVQWFVDGEEI
jgi:hypothetical protein